jgi:hypothetical protein
MWSCLNGDMTDSRSTITVPAALAEYAASRGYTGAPRIAQTYTPGFGWEDRGAVEILSPARVIGLREADVLTVSVAWRETVADFTLHELLPWTGLAGNPGSFPVEIAL